MPVEDGEVRANYPISQGDNTKMAKVAKMYREGYTSQQIAHIMNMSPGHVHNCIKEGFRKGEIVDRDWDAVRDKIDIKKALFV